MTVLRCDGCYERYETPTFTTTGSDHVAPVVIPVEDVGWLILDGWTITVHYHQEDE